MPAAVHGRALKYIAGVCAIAAAVCAALSGGASAQPPCRTAAEEPEFAFAAGCLVRRGERMLAVRHRYGGRLGFPGGRADPGENAQCVAHRETWEETGLDVIVHEALKRFDNGFALYRCELSDAAGIAAGEPEVPAGGGYEISRVLWIDPHSTKAADWRFPRDHPVVLEMFDD